MKLYNERFSELFNISGAYPAINRAIYSTQFPDPGEGKIILQKKREKIQTFRNSKRRGEKEGKRRETGRRKVIEERKKEKERRGSPRREIEGNKRK